MAKRVRTFCETDIDEILRNKKSKFTIYQENSAMRSLHDFVKYKEINVDFSTISKEELDLLLRDFFSSLRNGTDLFKRNTYLSVRQALCRHFKSVRDGTFDIINDTMSFPKSYEYFKCLLKTLKQEGKSNTEHFQEISKNDFNLITTKLNIFIPQQLQWFVFVLVGLFFARRGCENYENMKVGDFQFGTLENGRRFIRLKKDEYTKNHGAKDTEKACDGMIVETKHEKCPYRIIESYINKLNDKNVFFWQRCKSSFTNEDSTWFENKKHGVNTIKQFMPKISKFCGLSRSYTNHCLRVSTCTILGEKHTENDIKSISGHKSNSSLGIYKHVKDSKKETMALDLSKAIGIAGEENIELLDRDDQWIMNEVLDMETNVLNESKGGFVFNNCNVTINMNK